MERKKEPNYILIFSVMTLVIALVIRALRQPDKSLEKAIVFAIQQLVYMGMIIYWGLSLRQRVLDKQTKKDMTFVTILMLLWLLLRACKYRFFALFDDVERYLWYMFYIPNIMIPARFLAIGLEYHSFRHKKAIRRICITISHAVMLLVLTNDLHGLAFHLEGDYNHYSYRIGYYLAIVCIGLNYLGGFMFLASNSKLKKRSFNRYKPLIWLAVMGLYVVLYITRPWFLSRYHLIELPEAICLMSLGIIESTIRSGLIPTNTNYPYFFSVISSPAVITDGMGEAVFSTSHPVVLDDKTFHQALEGPVNVDEDTVLHEKGVQGGHIFWTESHKEINELTRQLSELGEALSGENDLLTAENNLRSEQVRLEEQAKIYDAIDTITDGQRRMVASLLEGLQPESDDYESRMSRICVYNAYIKRRSNLALLSAGHKALWLSELVYSLRESGDYLALCGVYFELEETGEELLSSENLCFLYDLFETLIEKNITGLQRISVKMEAAEPDLEMSLFMQKPEGITLPEEFASGLQVLETHQDSCLMKVCVRREEP